MIYYETISLDTRTPNLNPKERETHVVPVPTTELEHRGLEAELPNPRTRLGVISGEGDLTRVVVP